MITLKKLIELRFNSYLIAETINAGTTPVPVDAVLKSFQAFAPDLPISKSQMGRLLSSKFLKKQFHVSVGHSLTQCYYLNREV